MTARFGPKQNIERNTEIIRMFREGHSQREIGKHFHTSLGAVSGVIARARATGEKVERTSVPVKASKPSASLRAVSATALCAVEKRQREAAPPIAPVAAAPDYGLPRVSLEHVQDTDGCRFPIGTPHTPDFGFCGAEREHADPHNPISFFAGGAPYCAFHRHKTSIKTIRQIGEQSSRHDSGDTGRRVGGMGRS